VVLTYKVPQASIDSLNKKVSDAWNEHLPGKKEVWKKLSEEERTAEYLKVKPANPAKEETRKSTQAKTEELREQSSGKVNTVKRSKTRRPRVAKSSDSG
jgi:hypothetical protein